MNIKNFKEDGTYIDLDNVSISAIWGIGSHSGIGSVELRIDSKDTKLLETIFNWYVEILNTWVEMAEYDEMFLEKHDNYILLGYVDMQNYIRVLSLCNEWGLR